MSKADLSEPPDLSVYYPVGEGHWDGNILKFGRMVDVFGSVSWSKLNTGKRKEAGGGFIDIVSLSAIFKGVN